MTKSSLAPLRATIDSLKYADEASVLAVLAAKSALSSNDRTRIANRAAQLVRDIRASSRPGSMEVFLAEYGLSTDEGVALMCLAEALLRVPDADTIDALIEDKIAPGDWGKHLGHSSSSLVNASTWALMLTGRVLDEEQPGIAGALRTVVKRLGEPVIRTAVGRAMREMGRNFVLGETIAKAMDRAEVLEARGYSYSYDMLGEAARTEDDAQRYYAAYRTAIAAIAKACTSNDIRTNPGISVKLSALHPRYEEAQRARAMDESVPRVVELAKRARDAGMGFNIDAEEADRLSLSLDVIAAAVSDPALAGWDGFGIVVQAYGPRAGAVIDWLYALAKKHDRRFMVRLVKGAYWDTEIKHAQAMGVAGFPVFTRKQATDISYIANVRKLLGMTDRIYPQFATHNAHTAAAILEMAGNARDFEFQKLHGMGDRLHELLMKGDDMRCRVYAPVGAHRDLLAYLVRRLLENGANSSFVNRIVDTSVAPETVATDPFDAIVDAPVRVRQGPDLFQPERANSMGWDIAHRPTLDAIDKGREPFRNAVFAVAPLMAVDPVGEMPHTVRNPANPDDPVGEIRNATAVDVATAIARAKPWDASVAERAIVLNAAADLYEAHHTRLFALLAREAGKTLADATGELREAVDFLRYYAAQARKTDRPARGVFACISPWNFPLAIFTGQIAGALATGNGVLAKPAEQSPSIAHEAARLLLLAGVPRTALQLLPGDGATVGAALTRDKRINGVVFTGSIRTARTIRRSMADNLDPGAPLIAETGGLNAMIVDSTVLIEQAVRDVVQSAFQSAGQRCSALRCLYVQEDIARTFKKMLFGAMEALTLGDPWHLSTDVGPVIDTGAKAAIGNYLSDARANGLILKQLAAPATGHFIPPTVIEVNGILDLKREIFGPVLHLATFKAARIDGLLDDITDSGYGLTFGLHTRIDDRVQHIVERLKIGNIYVNRNQIGAVVGSQPFGGEGLSGTGPKAGGPDYLTRFTKALEVTCPDAVEGMTTARQVQAKVDTIPRPDRHINPTLLPGPTGESNRLSRFARAPILCMGPGPKVAIRQVRAVVAEGGVGVAVPESLRPGALTGLSGIGGAVWWGDDTTARTIAQALAKRNGPILPLIVAAIEPADVLLERHVCVDTTASGGNAELLAGAASSRPGQQFGMFPIRQS